MNEYKDAAALLALAARTTRQAYEKIVGIDKPFSENLAGAVFTMEAYDLAWKKLHAKQLAVQPV